MGGFFYTYIYPFNPRMSEWYQKLYGWSLKWTGSKWASWAMFVCAFADGSFFPLPTPVFFLTLSLINTSKTYKYAFFGTVGITLGALLGYFIGHYAWLTPAGDYTGLARFMFDHIPGFTEASYNHIHLQFERLNFGILFIASFMPLPFLITAISAGVFDINIYVFFIATLIGQGIRFYGMAFLIRRYGPAVKKLFDFRLTTIIILLVIFILLVILLFRIL